MLSPSYDNWAPFIGGACSVDEVCNTEYMKVSPAGPAGVEDDDNILNEDFLIELMTEKKVRCFHDEVHKSLRLVASQSSIFHFAVWHIKIDEMMKSIIFQEIVLFCMNSL